MTTIQVEEILPIDTREVIQGSDEWFTARLGKISASRLNDIMKKTKYGRMVNFTTVAVPLKLEGEAAYVASKAGVKSLTEVLSREYAEYNVTVNTIGPVPIETDLIRAVPADKIQNLLDRQAIQRFGVFEDVVNVIDFYLKPESSFITGQTLYLGGV